jgi:hypothetical protein
MLYCILVFGSSASTIETRWPTIDRNRRIEKGRNIVEMPLEAVRYINCYYITHYCLVVELHYRNTVWGYEDCVPFDSLLLPTLLLLLLLHFSLT